MPKLDRLNRLERWMLRSAGLQEIVWSMVFSLVPTLVGVWLIAQGVKEACAARPHVFVIAAGTLGVASGWAALGRFFWAGIVRKLCQDDGES